MLIKKDDKIIQSPKFIKKEKTIITNPTKKELEEDCYYVLSQQEIEDYQNAMNISVSPYYGLNYEDIVVELIRQKYTINDELAILRQKDTKASEFLFYNSFCEECKLRAKDILSNE